MGPGTTNGQPRISLPGGLALIPAAVPSGPGPYATSRLQRGLLLWDRDVDLAEEAVGFGVPVMKRGLQAVFPGSASLEWHQDGSSHFVEGRFILNRIERVSRRGAGLVRGSLFYAVKSLLAESIRRLPASRRPLTAASSLLRHLFGWETTYVDAGIEARMSVSHSIDSTTGKILVDLDCRDLPADVTEVVLMHEQGAHVFDTYQDSSGLRLRGDQIGCWDKVNAAEAWFESQTRRLAFKVAQTSGARLYRGRELVGSRLAWAGFGYALTPSIGQLHHEMTISRLT